MRPADVFERAVVWSKQLPPYAIVWLNDNVWHAIAAELIDRALATQRNVSFEGGRQSFYLRTVRFFKRSDRVTG